MPGAKGCGSDALRRVFSKRFLRVGRNDAGVGAWAKSKRDLAWHDLEGVNVRSY